MRGKKGKKRRKLCNPDERQIFFRVSFASWTVLFLTKEILSETAAWEFLSSSANQEVWQWKLVCVNLRLRLYASVCVCVVLELFLTHQMCTEIKSSGSFCLTVLSKFPFNVFVLSWHWLDKAPPHACTLRHTHTKPPPTQKKHKVYSPNASRSEGPLHYKWVNICLWYWYDISRSDLCLFIHEQLVLMYVPPL